MASCESGPAVSAKRCCLLETASRQFAVCHALRQRPKRRVADRSHTGESGLITAVDVTRREAH